MSNLLERVPPQSLEAEQAVLGSMLTDRRAIVEIADLLDAADFYSPQHRMLYLAMIDLFHKGRPVDLVTLQSALEDCKQLFTVGGTPYLLSLQEAAPTAVSARHYAGIVREKSLLRQIIAEAGELRNMAQSPGDMNALAIADEMSRFALGLMRGSTEAFIPVSQIISGLMNEIEQQLLSDRHVLGIPTGIARLDETISGWTAATYYVIAARPRIGKSAFAWMQCVEAARRGLTVGMFSLEMSSAGLGRRLLARELHVPLNHVMAARFSLQDPMREIAAVGAEAMKWRIGVCEEPSLTIAQLRGHARQYARQMNGIDLLAVDYLQLIGCESRGNRNEQVGEVSRGLRALANELNCALLVLSQLNRESEREKRMPRLFDLRESGSIEQDADVVIFLEWPYWEPEYQLGNRQYNQHMRRVDVAKQRNGPTGSFDVSWSGEYQRFAGLDTREEAML